MVARTTRRDLAIFAVGPQTTEEAQAARFTDVRNADGDAKALAQAAAQWAKPQDGTLLHVCGEEAPGTLADPTHPAREAFNLRHPAKQGADAVSSPRPTAAHADRLHPGNRLRDPFSGTIRANLPEAHPCETHPRTSMTARASRGVDANLPS